MMFDFKDYYNWVAKQMPNDCRVCEVGVSTGDSAIYLCPKLSELGKSFTMYMVDDMSYGGYDQMNELFRNIISSGMGEKIFVVPKDSISAAKSFNGRFLDFVFIDSSHQYEETKDSIKEWSHVLKDGCIIGGHDYFLYDGVRNAVDEIVPATFKRESLPDGQKFEEQKLLHIVPTEKNYGVWYFRKDFWIKLNDQ